MFEAKFPMSTPLLFDNLIDIEDRHNIFLHNAPNKERKYEARITSPANFQDCKGSGVIRTFSIGHLNTKKLFLFKHIDSDFFFFVQQRLEEALRMTH